MAISKWRPPRSRGSEAGSPMPTYRDERTRTIGSNFELVLDPGLVGGNPRPFQHLTPPNRSPAVLFTSTVGGRCLPNRTPRVIRRGRNPLLGAPPGHRTSLGLSHAGLYLTTWSRGVVVPFPSPVFPVFLESRVCQGWLVPLLVWIYRPGISRGRCRVHRGRLWYMYSLCVFTKYVH